MAGTPEDARSWSKIDFVDLLLAGLLTHPYQSQGPDLNRSVADLQSAAWPLRHLGRPYNGTHWYGSHT
jgi:hypothetical protein